MKSDSKIHIKILDSKGLSNLIPRYDREANILEVGNPNIDDWPYGVDINGNIIFDLDINYVLANFDLLIPSSLWKKENIIIPSVNKYHDIKFTKSTINTKSFCLPISVCVSYNYTMILIRFSKQSRNERVIKLSDYCIAIICAETLKGFCMSISNIKGVKALVDV